MELGGQFCLVKCTLEQVMKAYRGSTGIVLLFLYLLRLVGWVVNVTPRPLYPRERLEAHCRGEWVGPRAGLQRVRELSPPPPFDPRIMQPVQSRYTD